MPPQLPPLCHRPNMSSIRTVSDVREDPGARPPTRAATGDATWRSYEAWQPLHVVIIGGGIVGCSVACALAELAADATSPLGPAGMEGRSNLLVTIVEPSPAFPRTAAGSAAGFLSSDWCEPG